MDWSFVRTVSGLALLSVASFVVTFIGTSPDGLRSDPNQEQIDQIIDRGVQIVSTLGGFQIAAFAIAVALRGQMREFAPSFAVSIGAAMTNLGLAMFITVCGCPPSMELKGMTSFYVASIAVFLATSFLTFRSFARMLHVTKAKMA